MLQRSLETRIAHDRLSRKELSDLALSIVTQHADDVHETFEVRPLDSEFPYIAHELGAHGVYLADLSDNDARTFKWAGALTKGHHARANGAEQLFAASAGNHARGVALTSRLLGMPAQISVPLGAPPEKSRDLPGLSDPGLVTVRREGAFFDETLSAMQRRGETKMPGFTHAFNSKFVVAGQGTYFDKIIAKHPDVKRIVTGIGGAGLLAGMTQRRDQLGLTDTIEMVGVEAPGSNSLSKSLRNDKLTRADAPNPAYGGLQVATTGALPFSIMRYARNFSMIGVSEADIRHATLLYLDDRRELLRNDVPAAEPSSMVAIAGLYQLLRTRPRVDTVVTLTGRNAPLEPAHARGKTSRALHGYVWR